jgi:hypothetical protein
VSAPGPRTYRGSLRSGPRRNTAGIDARKVTRYRRPATRAVLRVGSNDSRSEWAACPVSSSRCSLSTADVLQVSEHGPRADRGPEWQPQAFVHRDAIGRFQQRSRRG